MALEAGEALHQFFAAYRVWQLEVKQRLPEHSKSAGIRIFGELRYRLLRKAWMEGGKQQIDQVASLVGAVLSTSNFHDDPNEKNRTLANMELACMVYAKETLPYLHVWPIWVADKRNPERPVGIEQVFDVVLEYEDGGQMRFIGTLDGILCDKMHDMRPTMAENKSAIRLDKGWIESFKMRHQVTGYMACARALFNLDMWHGRTYGLKVKPTYKGEDFHVEPVKRDQTAINHWANWARMQADIWKEFQNDWELAPRNTHACNRFFRPCALIPFCSDTANGRKEQWAQMTEATPSPSERAVQS